MRACFKQTLLVELALDLNQHGPDLAQQTDAYPLIIDPCAGAAVMAQRAAQDDITPLRLNILLV